jgi:glucose/arabinose dehydrogenase
MLQTFGATKGVYMAILSRRWADYFIFLALAFGLSQLKAATLPTGFTETQLGSNLNATPTAMTFAPDGRLFVCLQSGQLRVIKNGALLATPFVSLSVDSSGERGLLGVTFDPNFSSNQFVYVYYTTSASPIHNRISRFTANGDVAVSGSETILVDLDNLSSATNHNGGAIL